MFGPHNNRTSNPVNTFEVTEEQVQEISESNYQRKMPEDLELCFDKMKGETLKMAFVKEGKRERWKFQ